MAESVTRARFPETGDEPETTGAAGLSPIFNRMTESTTVAGGEVTSFLGRLFNTTDMVEKTTQEYEGSTSFFTEETTVMRFTEETSSVRSTFDTEGTTATTRLVNLLGRTGGVTPSHQGNTTGWGGEMTSPEIGFCRNQLWDSDLTWNTDNPDFTSCFQLTVLTYIPALVLLIGFPIQLYLSSTSRNRLTPWGLLITTRLIFIVAIMVISIVDLIILLTDSREVEKALYVAEGVRIVSYLAALVLQLVCKSRGEVTSGPLFIYWLVAAICGAPTFRSAVQSGYLTGNNQIVPVITLTVQYPFILAILFLSFWPDKKPKYIDLEIQAENLTPEIFSSFPSKMTFFWFDGFAWKGWKTLLTREDLWSLSLENRCRGVVPIWDKHWLNAVKKAKAAGEKLSILSTLVRCFGMEFFWSALLNLLYALIQFVNPQIVNLLIGFVESDEPVWRGYLYIVTIILATLLNTILNAQYFYLQWMIGLKVRTVITSAIYRKSLRLSNSARKEMTVGETTNLMAIDTQKFMDLVLYMNMLWSSPLQILLCIYFLWGILGPSSLAGLAVMVLMIPMNSVVASKMKKYQRSQMNNKDKRVKLMDEVLNGIKVLKLYAWEPSFSYKLLRIREDEINSLKNTSYLSAFTTFLFTCAPFLVAVSSFTVYILIDENNVLDAQTAFVSMTYFNLLRMPLNFLPMLIIFMVQTAVSLKRVNKFMNAEELDPLNVTHDENFNCPVFVEQADFTWTDDNTNHLRNISMTVEEGSLVAVVGQVGCGKSSLLSALLGDVKRTRGVANLHGKVAYVSQQAWIQNNTLEQNITFGKRFNKELYTRVLDACALTQDIEMLPGGDQTEIGEKGINLSGGQKQRVSVARSVYSNGSLYLLDDPLSAVDAHVGKHIFENVIGPKGLLKNKTRILVTHGVGFLKQMDKIVVMKDGTITETGTYKELLDQKGEFADFLVQYLSDKEDDVDPETETELEDLKSELVQSIGKRKLERQLSKARSEKSAHSSVKTGLTTMDKESVAYGRRAKHNSVSRGEELPEKVKKTGQNLIEVEKAEIGGVKWSVYGYYAKSIGYLAAFSSVLFYILFQCFSVGANIWLSRWSVDPLATTDIGVRNMYLGVYGALGFLQSISVMLATVLLAIFCLNAAIKMHQTMLLQILKAPMSFFDTTPLGRILNRFSKDIDIVDNTIPWNVRMVINQSLNVIGTLVAIVFAMPIFIVVVVPIAVIYYFLQKFYVTTARQVKRMEAITRSPIYTHFSETITGSSVIRAYERTQNFIDENEHRVDENQICYYPTIVANRWLGIRLEIIGNLLIMFASLIAVISRGSIDPGLVGLSLSYALNVTGALNMLVRTTTDVETNMVSVERIQEYQDVPQEAAFDLPENDPDEEWPQHGEVTFDNYQTRYREGLDLVLKGIDCRILSGEKIGIVGRTGAGKSSLTLALFRIIESAGGSILIDGVNIGQLGLGRLRSRITIIPQDPVLFTGSMRMNLDPFEQYSDRDIWRSLDQAHLKSTVANFPGGLHYEINEGGENLSVGQRQLVCLARALLRKTKVLVLDEATAAVDLETDDLVQATIRKEFVDCTVLTIAHRLNTILDSNRVMVLDQGKVVEFASPDSLLGDTSSIFHSMAKNAGLVNPQQ